ncbi:MAG: hypothetical protein NVS1B6_03150 [Steroidobacteraceae bacterium]
MPDTRAPETKGDAGLAGIPIDRYGGATIDPTKNVLDLVESTIRRIDDLRDAENVRVNMALDYSRQLREAESRRVDQEASLRADYTRQLTEAEAKRIDAIRAVDVNAVSVASSRASDQATVLANQVVASADTLRNLVATNATALATQLTQIIGPITDRLALLEKSNYEGKGREVVNSPMMDQLREEVSKLRAERNETTGKSHGVSATMAMGFAILAAIVAVLGLILRKG